jgi:hypothetical protein
VVRGASARAFCSAAMRSRAAVATLCRQLPRNLASSPAGFCDRCAMPCRTKVAFHNH